MTDNKIVNIAKSYVGKAHAQFRTEEVHGGILACAKVVSTILKEAGAMPSIEINVDKTVSVLKGIGWVVTPDPVIGGVVVWDRTKDFPNKHIGIITGPDESVNNSSYKKAPIITPIYSEDRAVLEFLSPPQTAVEPAKPAKDPVFKVWKGETAQDMLSIMWEVSGGNKDFVLTMVAENGTFEPKRKHPTQNNNGTWDYSFGLNQSFHWPMIEKILNDQVSLKEIAEYHWKIYNQGPTKACGPTPFCGWKRRNDPDVRGQIIFPN